MLKRFGIICLVVGMGLLILSGLGLSSLGMYKKGLAAERRQEFIAVAEQVRYEIKQQLDAFLQAEQGRPWTDYQYAYVPESFNQAAALVRSPLADLFTNNLAVGYFQLDSAGQIITPYSPPGQEVLMPQAAAYFQNIRNHLLPSLRLGLNLQPYRIDPSAPSGANGAYGKLAAERIGSVAMTPSPDRSETAPTKKDMPAVKSPVPAEQKASAVKEPDMRRGVYAVSPLEDIHQKTQVIRQSRAAYEMNVDNTQVLMGQAPVFGSAPLLDEAEQQPHSQTRRPAAAESQRQVPQEAIPPSLPQSQTAGASMPANAFSRQQSQDLRQRPMDFQTTQSAAEQMETVQVRIEPFVPITVPEPAGRNGIFAGQIFLLRHVQIEDRHWIQGFQLNEAELLRRVSDAVARLLRRGMDYEISRQERPDAAHSAILDFGFGEVVLNLLEQQPDWIQMQARRLAGWFWAILAVVWLAVAAAMAALWTNMRQQAHLSRKKDDFISAVSHELRTPLTSIRMYTEMLENNWIKTDDKRRQYYTAMRQESERLSRLIENVLDFSRIQRNKKQYHFAVGDVNDPIRQAAQMMRPCIEQAGFVLVEQLDEIAPFMFDRDAVMQIVVNLLDNAVKYARTAEDKHIFLRSRQVRDRIFIEVEDRGPGVPRSQQKKIFDAFYRCEDESTRQTAGTGLGLALVRQYAQAHCGNVEVAAVQPSGALFRVMLDVRTVKSSG